jgi:hypothetical protein
MMKLNNGDIKVINGKTKIFSDGLPYGENKVILKFIKANK